MTPAQFFDIFLQELRSLPELSRYYKYHSSVKDFEFRKAYFLQRLAYVDREIEAHARTLEHAPAIWDLGCGYGTTCLYLAMKGYRTYGSTLEFYYDFLPRRREFWAQYGESSLFTASYEDIYDVAPQAGTFDCVIVQDTLHHLEPIAEAIGIIKRAMRPGAVAICIEENGDNVVQRMKLYRQRGAERVMTYWDESLGKEVTMGNENIRGIATWQALFAAQGMRVDPAATEFIRLFPPALYGASPGSRIALREQAVDSKFLRKYFFFGINFVVR